MSKESLQSIQSEYTLKFTENTIKKLTMLRERTGLDVRDLIKMGLSLLDTVTEAIATGKIIFMEGSNGGISSRVMINIPGMGPKKDSDNG